VARPKRGKGSQLVVKSQLPRSGEALPVGTSVSVKLAPEAHHKKRH
jgi:hypothetical protein